VGRDWTVSEMSRGEILLLVLLLLILQIPQSRLLCLVEFNVHLNGKSHIHVRDMYLIHVFVS